MLWLCSKDTTTMKPFVLAIATMDTKADEINYVAQQIRETKKVEVRIVDVGTLDNGLSTLSPPNVSRKYLLEMSKSGDDNDDGKDNAGDGDDNNRTILNDRISNALIKYCDSLLNDENELFAGMVGIGGSCGTAIITPAMRSVPIGFPKIMVSTMASGDVGAYIGCADITMMHSVADIAGLNRVTEVVLGNASWAVAGMAEGWNKRTTATTTQTKTNPTLGMTQFGVTTVCCDAVREELKSEYEIVTFHATGAGGKAMEKLLQDGHLKGVLDLTTTEVADEIVGGVLSAGPERLDAFASAAVPMVMSLGALDMVNFNNEKTVPAKFSDGSRKLHVHNSEVTLMRTSDEECRKIARFIADKFNKSVAPAVLLIPSKGLSAIDVPGMPFHDPTADSVLFNELKSAISERDGKTGNLRKVETIDCAINDPMFAVEVAKWYRKLALL